MPGRRRSWKIARPSARAVRDIARLVLLCSVLVAIALALRHDAVRQYFEIDAWRETIRQGSLVGGRISAALLFVGAGGVAISLGLPRIWVAAVGGAVYGAVMGFFIAMLAAFIGAAVGYQLGHFLLRDLVSRRVGGRLKIWRKRFQENAFWWVLYGRLFPLSNSTANNLLCGSCDVPFVPYLSASFLGFIPHTFIFSMFGSGGAKANMWQIGLGCGLLLLSIFFRKFLRAAFPISERKSEEDEGGFRTDGGPAARIPGARAGS